MRSECSAAEPVRRKLGLGHTIERNGDRIAAGEGGSGMDVQSTIAQARDAITVRRVFGEPYEKNGITVIPAAKVQGGAGGGGGQDAEGAGGSGTGFGITARPVGAYVIKDGDVAWRPALDINRVILGGQILGIVALLAFRLVIKDRARTDGGAPSDRTTRRTYWHRGHSGGRRHLVGRQGGNRKMHMVTMGIATMTRGRPLGGGRRQTVYRTGGPWAVRSTGGEIEVAPAPSAWVGVLRPARSTPPTIVNSLGGLLNAVITQFQQANIYNETAYLIDEVAEQVREIPPVTLQVREIPPVTVASLVRDFTDTVGRLF
jgi:uncharacterized spore protein YtfJ